MELFILVFVTVFCVLLGTKRRQDTSSGDQANNTKICYFESVGKCKLETSERTPRFNLRPCKGEINKKIIELKSTEVDNYFGAKDALGLVLCRGSANCIDKIEPTQLAEYENSYICEEHIKQLLTHWDNKLYAHILIKQKKGNRQMACSFPNNVFQIHDELIVVKSKKTNAITVQDSMNILKRHGSFIPPGIPMCEGHRKYVDSLEDDGSEFEEPGSVQSTSTTITTSTEDNEQANSKNANSSALAMPEYSESCIKQLFFQFAKAAGFCRILSRKALSKMSPATQLKKASMVRSLLEVILKFIAPSDWEDLREMVMKREYKSVWTFHHDENLTKIIKEISMQYRQGENRAERIAILSTIARIIPLNQIQLFIPGLTRSIYDDARRVPKIISKTEKRKRDKYEPESVNMFIEFITSNIIMSPHVFGSQKIRFSDGTVEHIPQTIRKQSATEIINMFKKYLKDTDQEDFLFSDNVYYKILNVCAATEMKSYSCVDYFKVDAYEGQKEIINVLDFMKQKKFISTDHFEELSERLFDYLHYLKTDYYLHIKQCSRIPDHCLKYSLSDLNNIQLSTPCDHDHDIECDRCEAGRIIMMTIQDTVQSVIEEIESSTSQNNSLVNRQILEDLKFRSKMIDESITRINELKKHIIRSRASELSKISQLKDLGTGEVFILMDYAQKILPMKHRESQKDYFGKVGMSWHITHVTTRIDGQFMSHNIIHIMKEKQTSEIVVAIIDHIISILKEKKIRKFYFRSDNAGNYHSASTIASLLHLSKKHNVTIEDYSFSESQDGKSHCDRIAAVAKRKVRTAVDHGCDVTNEDDLFNVLGNKSLMNSSSVYLCRVKSCASDASENKKKLKNGPKIPMISQLFHFKYTQNGIIGYGYKNIGEGLTILEKDLHMTIPLLMIEKKSFGQGGFWFSPKQNEKKDNRVKETQAQENQTEEVLENSIYGCPVTGCIKKYYYYTGLQRHLLEDDHDLKPERITLTDYALNLYKDRVEHFSDVDITIDKTALENIGKRKIEESVEKGWALKTRRKPGRFSKNVIDALTEIFDEGNSRGLKYTPEEAQKLMQQQKNTDKSPKFNIDEYLSARQIGSFFSRLKSQREQKKSCNQNATHMKNEKESDEYDFESDMPLDNFIHQSINKSRGEIFDKDNDEKNEPNVFTQQSKRKKSKLPLFCQ